MKNADMPAMPIEFSGFGQFAPEAHTGLTKREMFAMSAMQGMLSHPDIKPSKNIKRDEFEKYVAAEAVEMADALLSELEQSK